ncbi:MAG: hypothetical protein KKD69_06385, partial [Euryarchaeota archaeon]|nr:hypothetical protein [Euryarchaeota archaeon]
MIEEKKKIFEANGTVEKFHKQLPERIRKYLIEQRGLSDEIISRFKIGWDENKKEITIPIYNKELKFTSFKYRKDPEDQTDKPKYLLSKGSTAEIYGWENIISPKEPYLVMCEGELDRLALESKGIPAITITTGAATRSKKWKE